MLKVLQQLYPKAKANSKVEETKINTLAVVVQ